MFVESAIGTTPDPAAFARLVQVGLVALPVSLLTGLLAVRWRLGVRRRRRFKADYHAWQELYTSWASLRCCHRCDGVFAPGERQLLALLTGLLSAQSTRLCSQAGENYLAQSIRVPRTSSRTHCET